MEAVRKHSYKRDAILDCLRSTTCHPTAEWVYARLKPSIPDLSLGTVYRNLAIFKNAGEILSVGTVDGQERYDGNVKPHDHFVCTRCGAVIDVQTPPLPDEVLASVRAQLGAQVSSYGLTFTGVCENCNK